MLTSGRREKRKGRGKRGKRKGERGGKRSGRKERGSIMWTEMDPVNLW